MADTEIVIAAEPLPDEKDVVVDTGGKTAAEPKGAKVVTADEGIEDFKEEAKRAQEASRQRLAQAERTIQDAFKVNADLQKENVVVKRDAVGTLIESLNKDKEGARRDYKTAMEAGDFDKAAEAQDRMSLANARIVAAERGKMELDEAAKAPVQQQRPPVIHDDVEVVARNMASQRSADWIRQHPEAVSGRSLTPKVLEAHYGAIDAGHAADSDGYFSYIETKIGSGGRQVQRDDTREPPERQERQASSAPVRRDPLPSSTSPTRPRSVRLTTSEQSAAIATYAPLYPGKSDNELYQLYAKDKVALMEQDKIDGKGRIAS